MKQNDAVFAAVCSVLSSDSFDGAVVLSKEQREMVVAMVTEGIISGSVVFSLDASQKYDTPEKKKGYVTGMVGNHLRKDKRLNGGEKYEIKKPGSRAGSGDATLKALKALQTTVDADSESWHQIEAAIYERTTELSKKKEVTINVEALPEEFRHLVK
jgi:hypothetical protein